MSKLRLILDRYFYFKLCYNQAGSYTGILTDLAQKFLLLAVFLKAYNITNYFIIFSAFIFFFLTIIYLGHIAVKLNLNKLETSFFNQYNPELIKILEQTKNDKFKK